jgi:microcystin-dependent protein
MSQPFVGEIRMFAGNFAPAGWMFCDGALLPISEVETLFQLIGTTYGGDGQSTFALPDLRGRVPLHFGVSLPQSTQAGTETETLTLSQMPAHAHAVGAGGAGTTQSPAGAVVAQAVANLYHPSPSGTNAMLSSTIQPAGGSQPHSNLQPYLCINFIISLFGIFPSQS